MKSLFRAAKNWHGKILSAVYDLRFGSDVKSFLTNHKFIAALSAVAALLMIAFVFADAYARVGGGQTYRRGGSSRSSGSRSSGGSRSGGSGGDGALVWFLIRMMIDLIIYYPAIGVPLLIAIVAVGYYVLKSRKQTAKPYVSSHVGSRHTQYAPAVTRRHAQQYEYRGVELDDVGADVVSARFERLRQHDPNFSEILFTDFIYTLYGKVQESRGRKDLDNFSSYLAPGAIDRLKELNGPGLEDVTGVIVGASRVIDADDPVKTTIQITVSFEANYTEVYRENGREYSNAWYTRERWHFQRKRDLLSRKPDDIAAIRCPKCGGPLEKNPDGSCAYCGVVVTGGDFDWYVTELYVMERESQGPLLTSDVPEEGTDLPTVYQYNFQAVRDQFMQANPDFSWQTFDARVRHIFIELQTAWSNLEWERARPYETDNIFQMHMFWINEYRRQQLRNMLRNPTVDKIVPVKITTDAFFDSITLRIFASMIDYTVDAQGRAVSGNPNRVRRFSEYWTFIRRRGAKPSAKSNAGCPNCGASLNINMAGICDYCGSKITSGDFDWVLTRIEQDESYKY